MTKKFFFQILEIEKLLPNQWAQACLPLKALESDLVMILLNAYPASFMTSSPQLLSLFFKDDILNSQYGRTFQDSIARINLCIPEDSKKLKSNSLSYSSSKQLQHYYHKFYTDYAHSDFMNKMKECTSKYHKVRSLSIQGELGGLFLIAGPKRDFKFTKQEFLIASWLRLGIPLKGFDHNYVCKCADNSKCKAPIGPNGQHCFVCKLGNLWSLRHNELRDIIYQLANDARVTRVVREPTSLFSTTINSDTGKPSMARPDILIKDVPFDYWSQHRFYRDVILDISVTYPATFNCINTGNSDINQGSASKHAFNGKKNKYGKLNKSNLWITPIIFETFGFIHEKSESFLRRLIHLASENSFIRKSVLHSYWFKRLSVALHRSNARMVLNFADRIKEDVKKSNPSSFDDTFKHCFNNPSM